MTEGEKGEQRLPTFVPGSKKPEPIEGYVWRPEYNKMKKDQVVGWRRFSATPHEDSEGFFVPPEAEGKGGQVSKKERDNLENVSYDRGNYNADIVAEEMEKREEQKEKNVRQAMNLPQEDES